MNEIGSDVSGVGKIFRHDTGVVAQALVRNTAKPRHAQVSRIGGYAGCRNDYAMP